ncbi:hypothetical protein [Streptomyces sp. ODS28]|uniref:hypothetical protein n=1 Tax=Streptomyces sp. ODS28 TaxID=3136688 RepID=UPI0031E8CC6B
MEAIAASVIAVLGTLLGAALTHYSQQRTAGRAAHLARREQLRQERLDAYSTFAGALINYRRSLVHRWFCENEQPPPDDPDAARKSSYEIRSQAQEALFRVHMLTDDDTLTRLADTAFYGIDGLNKAEDRTRLDHRRDETRAAINEFVTTARTRIQAGLD